MSSAPPSPAICPRWCVIAARSGSAPGGLARCEAQQRERDHKHSEQKGRKLRGDLRTFGSQPTTVERRFSAALWRFAGAIASAGEMPEARRARAGRALPAVRRVEKRTGRGGGRRIAVSPAHWSGRADPSRIYRDRHRLRLSARAGSGLRDDRVDAGSEQPAANTSPKRQLVQAPVTREDETPGRPAARSRPDDQEPHPRCPGENEPQPDSRARPGQSARAATGSRRPLACPPAMPNRNKGRPRAQDRRAAPGRGTVDRSRRRRTEAGDRTLRGRRGRPGLPVRAHRPDPAETGVPGRTEASPTLRRRP